MSPEQLADFNRRAAGSNAPATPVKDLPRMVEALAEFATNPKRKDALKKLDASLDDWRKALGVSVTGK